ncbi:MAG: UDP-N-acetylmuramoyl-tripeptide--D-alanyl-D-alanine ligase [Rickettsiaceae bacterium]|nr:UDP-N-acetylmuramoyl-tripeptide--D-alanyl-D-alanine ligase [Rickettsiaceae bacterium]
MDILPSISAGKVEFNSLDINRGDIFVTLSSGARNGSEFALDALERGAGAVITDKHIAVESQKVIYVQDPEMALRKMAIYKRERAENIIAITGSCGKTSTKEATNFLLSLYAKSFANRGTFNNFIGVPLTLASIPNDSEFISLEIGMSNLSEIRELTKLARPNYAIITNIGTAHLESLGSVENICRAKCEIFENMEGPKIGIINADTQYFELQKQIAKTFGIEIYTIAKDSKADCVLENFEIDAGQASVEYNIMGTKIKTISNVFGAHQSVNLCAPLLLIKLLGLDIQKAANHISNIFAPSGRGQSFYKHINGKKIFVIDDSYNANPDSVKASLKTFTDVKGKKILILADMLELGQDSASMHVNLKHNVIDSGASTIYCIGEMMHYLHQELKNEISSIYFADIENDVFRHIFKNISEEDCSVLIKGSKGTQISQFVDYIKSHF